MIKFFRKIRQKMLTENKFSKYFLYAIGEIILVVIGILIALSINNWNEERKNTELEKTYLYDVNQEFNTNKIQFERTLALFNKKFELADSITKKVFPITNVNWPQIMNKYESVFYNASFDPSNSSINVLINSGKINLIKNNSLKKLLLSWNDRFEDYKEEEKLVLEWRDVFNEIYLDEPSLNLRSKSDNLIPLSTELKIKLEKLMRKRRSSLGMVISKWEGVNQESKELMNVIDSVISLTRIYIYESN